MIRKAEKKDLPEILRIYGQARAFMQESGNPDQWGTTYPPRELVEQDLQKENLYVAAEDHICGVFYFSTEEEPDYRVITEGRWLSDAPCGIIHRVAADGTKKGLVAEITAYCWQQIPHLRIDTHENNRVMQHVLEKNGFVKCGIVHMQDGSPRLAYEKTEKKEE